METVFRPRSNYFWAGVSFMLIFFFAINTILTITNTVQIIFELLLCVTFSVFTYLIWIKPKLVFLQEYLVVVNPIRRETIAYAEVLELETKWSLRIIHSRGAIRVWVAPASGKRQWIADKRLGFIGSRIPLSPTKTIDTGTMSGSLNSFSGQAAYLIRERIKRLH